MDLRNHVEWLYRSPCIVPIAPTFVTLIHECTSVLINCRPVISALEDSGCCSNPSVMIISCHQVSVPQNILFAISDYTSSDNSVLALLEKKRILPCIILQLLKETLPVLR